MKYSRRAILKRLGIGAGFLPLLSTENGARRARPPATRRASSRITWTDGICPPDFYPTGAAGPLPATLPFTLQPLATWASKMIVLRHATKQQSPVDINVMIDVGSKYGGHFTYPAMLTGAVSSPNGNAEVPTISATVPSIDQIFADSLLDTGRVERAAQRRLPAVQELHQLPHGGTPNTQQNDPYKLFNSLFGGTGMHAGRHERAASLRRKSVLDHVGRELTNFAKNLGTEDKAAVMIHLDSIRSLGIS